MNGSKSKTRITNLATSHKSLSHHPPSIKISSHKYSQVITKNTSGGSHPEERVVGGPFDIANTDGLPTTDSLSIVGTPGSHLTPCRRMESQHWSCRHKPLPVRKYVGHPFYLGMVERAAIPGGPEMEEAGVQKTPILAPPRSEGAISASREKTDEVSGAPLVEAHSDSNSQHTYTSTTSTSVGVTQSTMDEREKARIQVNTEVVRLPSGC